MLPLIALLSTLAQQVPPAATPPAQPIPATPELTLPDDAADMEEFFTILDTDKDQVVTRAEFEAFSKGTRPGTTQNGVPALPADAGMTGFFGMMDANGDGRITKPEFDAFSAAAEIETGSGD